MFKDWIPLIPCLKCILKKNIFISLEKERILIFWLVQFFSLCFEDEVNYINKFKYNIFHNIFKITEMTSCESCD